MTTKITVDAHAGLPVEVRQFSTLDCKQTIIVVEPGAKQDFYAHSTMELFVRELPLPPVPEPVSGDSDLTQTTPS